jgi:hypothetical protein
MIGRVGYETNGELSSIVTYPHVNVTAGKDENTETDANLH